MSDEPKEKSYYVGWDPAKIVSDKADSLGSGQETGLAEFLRRGGKSNATTFSISVPMDGNRGTSFEDFLEANQEAILSALREGMSFSGSYAGQEKDKPAPRTPPQSYKNARDKIKAYIVSAPKQAFDDIIGNDEALDQLKDAIRAPVEDKELNEVYGMTMPKGALLCGPPGCGKTMFARAAAAEMKELYGESGDFISISGTELQSPYVGVTEQIIKAIFDFAREYKAFHGYPLLVFMDEAEVFLPDRTGRARRVAPWEESQVATFLAEMDGMQESGAFVLLATNRPEVIDQAVLRDGRCDFKITVKRPTRAAIEVIVRKSLPETCCKDGLDELVDAAMQGFFDISKVLLEFEAMKMVEGEQEPQPLPPESFRFEHILSGAMAASIGPRAKRYAFARDKAARTITGITADDVTKSVEDLFEENKGLQHQFALNEFLESVQERMKAMAEHGTRRIH